MHVLIVDDEDRVRRTLLEIIKLDCPQITLIEEANSVKTAIKAIQAKTPDVLLLDIRLGNENGFDILRHFADKDLNVIFITAYNEYAIKALKVSAIDYLLKPIDPDEFVAAIQKTQEKIEKSEFNQRINLFLENIENGTSRIKKITLKTVDRIYIVKVEDIIYCKASGNYTTFFLINNQKIMVSKTLKESEELLPPETFMRIHQSYLANLNHVTQYEKGNKNVLICSEQHEIPVSLRRREPLIQFLKKLTN